MTKHCNRPDWPNLSLPHMNLLIKQAGEYIEWTYTISALSAAVKVFGGEEDGELMNEGETASLDEIESFSRFARGVD